MTGSIRVFSLRSDQRENGPEPGESVVIETQDDLLRCLAAGIEMGQGFFFPVAHKQGSWRLDAD